MTVAGILIFAIFRFVLSFFVEDSSMLMFYIIVLISVYTIKLGVDIFLMSSYNKKTCVLISLGINIVFYILMVCFEGVEGIYDSTINVIVADYSKHLEIVFKRDMTFITKKTVVGFALFINFFIIILIIPSVIKFGNWYAKTLK